MLLIGTGFERRSNCASSASLVRHYVPIPNLAPSPIRLQSRNELAKRMLSTIAINENAGRAMLHYPRPPFPNQHQPMPGKTAAMNPAPDHGETSYKGSGRLNGKKAVITGGDSGIGRAVALAYAREGADVLISYLNEHDDARETERLVTEAGRKAVLLPGDIQDAGQCRAVIAKAISELGGIDILVNNAAHQASFKSIDEISDEEWELTFKVNIHAMFYLTKAAVPHMKPGSCIINTASINSDVPTRRYWPTQRPRVRSTISRRDWRRCSPRRAFVPMRSPRDRSGRRSFHPPCLRTA